MEIDYKLKPVLDHAFVPAVIWNRSYRRLIAENSGVQLLIGLKSDAAFSVYETTILPVNSIWIGLTAKYVERLLKFLIWQKGGYQIFINNHEIAELLAGLYSSSGKRSFDYKFIGEKIYNHEFKIEYCKESDFPGIEGTTVLSGRNLNGCRIGFDLGGSDRKCAALIDGKVVFSEEIVWNPYFENDYLYHLNGIQDSLKRAAKYLPRVDAIGGSAAGVYVNNKVKAASLFRGISENYFRGHIENIFIDIRKMWNNIPFEVVNDGEVAALAGSMSINDNAVLAISMGTSTAAGYVTLEGRLTSWLNELAFAPVDYRDNGPVDEWSGDRGCGVQFMSQQAVARLATAAGIEFAENLSFAQRLIEVQNLMSRDDERAERIYETIGTCLGYTVAHYFDFYEFRNLLLMGRVMSGTGGSIIIKQVEKVLQLEFPELANKIKVITFSEKNKRHGQAIAAASLPVLKKKL